ncbi:hypothetical protein FBULB1_7 [Fusarium bulbicola]|nr:hypothetical protein FBULB1_7 [Fusarium bulbicola]
MSPRSSKEGQANRPYDGSHDDQPPSDSAQASEAPREQQANISLVPKSSRKRRLLRGPGGEVMIPEALPQECFWAKLKCAHGRNSLHFLSEFEGLMELDCAPWYELTFGCRRWWEDYGPWLDAYKEALEISDEGWKMREEVMKQDDSVPDDEGVDDWDFICVPIPGDEEGRFCSEFGYAVEEEEDGEAAGNAGKEKFKAPFNKLASLHPNWPWVFTMRGVDRFKWWRQECCKRIREDFGIEHNFIVAYGALEIAHFDSVFQPDSNYRDFWPEFEGIALTLLTRQRDFNIVKLHDSRHARNGIVGYLVLAAIDALKRQDLFKPNSEIRNLGSVLLTFIHWRLDAFYSFFTFFNICGESLSWICKVVDLAEEANVELSVPYRYEVDYRKIKNLRDSPAGRMDRWENVDWQSRLRDYKLDMESDILGGHEFDITRMTEVERLEHEEKQVPREEGST